MGTSASMSSSYAAHGIRFRYSEEWELSEQEEDGRISITVSSPHTSFWTVSLFSDRPEPDDLIEAALQAFRDEYEELDVYPSKVRLCRRPTVACDIDFVCLELLNVARLRAFKAAGFTVLVLYQGNDAEMESQGPILEQITRSLAVSGDKPR